MRIGAPERYIVASAEQQLLVPHLLPQLLSPLCVEHPALGPLFSRSADFRRALKLRALDLPLLAAEIRTSHSEAPSRAWLQAFWRTAAQHTADATATAGTAGGAGGPRVGTGPEPALLEVNVFPAIAAGTMAAVPRDIYARLVDDTLRLLAPILDAPAEPAPPPLGGFADVHLVAAD